MTTATKLSPAQTKALTEVHELGYTNARKNTLDSVAKYITANGPTPEDGLKLNADGLRALDLPVEDPISDAEILTDAFEAIVEKSGLMSQWSNSEVWADLSLDEVKEDIKTARPINRKARRLHTRLLTSEYRKVFCPRPRKALKLTGAKGV